MLKLSFILMLALSACAQGEPPKQAPALWGSTAASYTDECRVDMACVSTIPKPNRPDMVPVPAFMRQLDPTLPVEVPNGCSD